MPESLLAIYRPLIAVSRCHFWHSLPDLGALRPQFSWNRCKAGVLYSRARLDYVVVTSEWSALFPRALSRIVADSVSDHYPIILNTLGRIVQVLRPFHFEAIRKESRKALSKWNREQFDNLNAQLTEARKKVEEAQRLPNSEVNIEIEREAMIRLNDMLAKEEQFWKQKARVDWLAKRDRCKKYFFLTTMAQRRHNHIDYVRNDEGSWLKGREAIGNAITAKFCTLFTSQGVTCLSNPDGISLTYVDTMTWTNLLAISS
ncbi:Endonuclease/exonuclease/phosphatase [Parasponia andersonii]|uniref:Endonuclease/exonuclease/phosphatase n=1 Tax=Parasponia andersonii TaxID=3476 RepID=A0A2P5AUK6_PARAD|nr:Endonuclease/exonuclease/phosphatase [Parasponia andersonii]